MSVVPGTRFGPYEVVSPLGAGGMGEVYRARDTRLDRLVALKILPGGARADPAFRERFAREARTISSLSHPNICALFDVGEQDGTSYLVMEYLDGETLAVRLARGPLPLDAALQCAIQIADGLSRAHALGIVHRDLKPGNLMLLDGGLVKILDFGLAKRFIADPDDATVAAISQAGVMSGTVAYMSPEQALGGLVDHRSDLFAFGVVLYEMLTGERPFEGASAFSVLQKITSEPAPPLRPSWSSVPAAVSDLVEQMLQKRPADRPQSAQDVARALRTAAGQSASASPFPRAEPQPVPAFRRRAVTLAGSAAIVLLVALTLPAVRGRLAAAFRAGAPAGMNEGSGPSNGPAKSAYEWTTEGRAHLRRFDRRENIDRAIDAFTRAVATDPSHAFGHAGLAEAYLRKDSATPDPQWIRQATESARRSVQLNPDLAAAHAALGLVLVRAKQPEEGRTSLARALDLDPTLALAHVGMGEYYMSRGDAKGAEGVYRKAAALAPDEWHPVQQLGRSLYAQARYAEAAATWEEARTKSPDNPLVLRNLGAVYHMLERTDDAAAALQRALEIEPGATLYSNLGTLRFFQGRYSDAAAAFEKAVELNPTYYLYWANLGDACRRLAGSEERARAAYSRAIALVQDRLKGSPLDPDLQTQLALYVGKTGEYARALQLLQGWSALPKKTPASYFRALLIHEIGGDREAALAALKSALGAGYAIREIREEPELARLRSDPRYHRIVTPYDSPGSK